MKKFSLKSYINAKISKSVTSPICDNMWVVIKDYAFILENYLDDSARDRNKMVARALTETFIEKDLRKKFGK